MAWEDTLQNWGTTFVDRWSDATFQRPYDLQALQLQAMGQTGYYTEGQPTNGVNPMTGRQNGGGISGTTLLLIGGVLVAFMLLKD